MCQIMPEPIAGTLRTVNGNLRRNDERVNQRLNVYRAALKPHPSTRALEIQAREMVVRSAPSWRTGYGTASARDRASRAGLQERRDCFAQDPQRSTALQKPDQAATADAAGGRLPNAPRTCRAEVRPSARGMHVAERPQRGPDPWHDRQGYSSLLAQSTFASSFPFKPRGLNYYGVADALAGVEVVFGSRPGRFI